MPFGYPRIKTEAAVIRDQLGSGSALSPSCAGAFRPWLRAIALSNIAAKANTAAMSFGVTFFARAKAARLETLMKTSVRGHQGGGSGEASLPLGSTYIDRGVGKRPDAALCDLVQYCVECCRVIRDIADFHQACGARTRV